MTSFADMEPCYFEAFPEYWHGEWRKIGHEYPLSRFNLLDCESCKIDAMMDGRKPVKLYKVKGITSENSWYDVRINSCSCSNLRNCWGPNERYWTVLNGYSANQFVFKSSIGTNCGGRSYLDEIRVNVVQGQGELRLEYGGICTARNCQMFFPLISKCTHPVRRVVVKMRSGEPVPANKNWFENLKWMYPNHLHVRIFEPFNNGVVTVGLNVETEEFLEANWNEIRYIFKLYWRFLKTN